MWDLLLVPVGCWASIALHELAHAVAFRTSGVRVLAVGTGRPPLVARVRVRGVTCFVGRAAPFEGLTVAEAEVSVRRLPFVLLAGPAVHLLLIAALLGWPGRLSVAATLLLVWNAWFLVVNGIPLLGGLGSDGTRAAVALRGKRPATVDFRLHLNILALYEAIDLPERARTTRAALAVQLAYLGLPKAAEAAAAPLGTADAARPLINGFIDLTARRPSATTRLEAMLTTTNALPEWAATARLGLAIAHGRWGEIGSTHPLLVEVPEAERALVTGVVELEHACRAGDPARAERAAEQIGALAWFGEMLLAEAWLAAGDRAAARRHALAARAAADLSLFGLPPALQPELHETLVPARQAIARCAGEDPTPSEDELGKNLVQAGGLLSVVALVIGIAGLHKAGSLLAPGALTVLAGALFGLTALARYAPLARGVAIPGGRWAATFVIALVGAALWFGGRTI